MPEGRRNPLNNIILKNTAAIGGTAAVKAIHNLRMKLHIVENRLDLGGVYVADDLERMRIDIYAGDQRLYTEGYDGKRAWSLSKRETKGAFQGEHATAALRHGVELPGKIFWLYQLREKGAKISLEGTHVIDGTKFFVLRVVLRDGFVVHLYVSSESFLIERMRDKRALHPNIDQDTAYLESVYNDFKKTDGVVRAFKDKQIDMRSGIVLSTTDIESVRVNISLDPDLYACPK
jgi:hypothetical protein